MIQTLHRSIYEKKWFGHVIRMNAKRLPAKALNWKPNEYYTSAKKLLEDSGKRGKSSLKKIAKETK